jgi:site-specific recombinase XerD
VPKDYYPSGPFIRELARDDEFEVAREDFLLGFRERTARAYKTDLEDFREWCSGQGVDPTAPTEKDIAEYMHELEARGYSSGTVGRRMAALRGFLRHNLLRGRGMLQS